MRSSLIILAIVLATLRVLQAALGRRVGSPAPVRLARRHRLGTDGERRATLFAEWRYYGFSHHAPEDAEPAADPSEIVASSPAVGSVVTILPDDSVTTVVNGRVYRRCGSVWYQSQSIGSNVTYVVVPAP